MARNCYFYCIVESKKDDSFGNIGIGGSNVYTVGYKDLAAVISNSIEEGSVEVLKDGVTHQKVVEAVMKKYSVVPMSFGQIPKSEGDVKGFLTEHYDALKKLFRKIEGKDELGVKLSWKMEDIMKKIVDSNDRIRILQKQISTLPETKSYYLKIELGKLVADELKTRGEAVAGEVMDALSPLVAESKQNKLLNDRMILNAAFLVPKEKESQFDKLLNEIEKKHPELVIRYVAAPPYNFVSIGGA